ncbi:MAG: TetR family transcriptional regulator [Actinomycetota bacterium]
MAPVRDAEATRARILAAATSEFAARGLAGARVDRIAASAAANKSLIYAYFGSKDQLFDHVVEASFEQMHAGVTFTPHDLPGYATALFDYLADHPDVLRIDAWRRLERPSATDAERAAYIGVVDRLTEVQSSFGANDQFLPGDVLAIVTAVAGAWAGTPDALRPHISADRERQRALVGGVIAVLTKSQRRRSSKQG